MKTSMTGYIGDLLKIIEKMRIQFPKKRFSLDGLLVGDIGEILAEELYQIDLFPDQRALHDGTSNGRFVQIKTTMKGSLGFGEIPDFYLGLKVNTEGQVEEIFNGPGALIWEKIKHRKRPKTFLFNISIGQLQRWNREVPQDSRIPRRQSIDR